MDKEEKIFYLSAKPSSEIFGLFQEAERLDADGLARAEIFERAERYFIENFKKIDFQNLSKRIKTNYDGELPSSFKVRINNLEMDEQVNDLIRDVYKINRVMTPFKLKLVLKAYIEHLKGVECKKEFSSELNNVDSLKVKAISLIIDIDDVNNLILIIDKLEKLRNRQDNEEF